MLLLSEGKPLPTKDEMLHFLDSLAVAPHIAIDTEADYKVDPLLHLGFSMAYSSIGMYFPVGHLEQDANIDEEVFKIAMEVMATARLRVFQHAGHDLDVLEEGYNNYLWDKPFVCTMIMAHMIDENIISKSLDHLHKTFVSGGVGKIRHPLMQQIIDTMGWRFVPVYLMNEYGTQDAVATSQLFLELEPLYKIQFGRLYNEG